MTEVVLDASAVLAVIRGEAGSERIETYLRTGCISAVNLSEVVAKLQERGMPDDRIDEVVGLLDLDVRAFDASAALAAGKLRTRTRAAGLSLGDRACLALAGALGATAITTDRAWTETEAGVPVDVVR